MLSQKHVGSIMIYKGVGGSLELLEDRLIIRRTTFLGTFLHGLKGDKTIPYSAITAVQYKRPFPPLNGYIQFTLGGGNESKKGMIDAVKDENSLFFSDAELFLEARKFVEDRIGNRAPIGQVVGSIADNLEKLAALRDRGILSPEEFEEQKAKALGKKYSPASHATAEIDEPPSETKVRMMAAMEQAIQTAPMKPAGGFGKRSVR
jgi:hypothetical protein